MDGHTGKISLARIQSLKWDAVTKGAAEQHLKEEQEKQSKTGGTFCQCYLQLLAISSSGIS